MRRAAVVLAAGLAAPTMSSAARSADVTNPADESRWTGTAPIGVPGPVPGDEHVVTVDLNAGAQSRPGGIQFAIRWAREADDLEMQVVAPDGTVHTSQGIVSTSEAVIVPGAPDGAYRVSVWSSSGDGIAYEGLAEMEYLPEADPARPLLPDLTSRPARNTHFATAQYLFDATGPVTATSCYPEEMAEKGARTCLRFDQIVANDGEGPFELRYTMPPESASPSGDANLVRFEKLIQRVYWSDSRTPTDRFADTYEFHPAHAHFHYRNFAVSALWAADATGAKLAGSPAKVGSKNGFCMIDVEMSVFGGRDAARTYRAPACLAPTDGGTENVNGISPGWADVYNWFLADQYIEVTGLADGYYVLETIADPANTVWESDETNNCSAVLIRISGGLTKSEIVRPMGACT